MVIATVGERIIRQIDDSHGARYSAGFFSTSLLKAVTHPAAFFFWRCVRIICMSNSELIGCDLAWKRDGADWLLLHKRRRMGRVAPDSEHRGMYRVVLSRDRLSDMANLSWAKDAALAAAVHELDWESRKTCPGLRTRATDPQKCPVKGGPLPARESLVSLSSQAVGLIPLSTNASPESSITALSSL